MQQLRKVRAALRPWRYPVAVGASVGAIGLRILTRDFLQGFDFITLFPTFIVSALFLGWRAGLLTAAVGAFLIWLLVFPPEFSLAVTSPSQVIALGAFAIASLPMVWASAAFERHLEEVEEERRAAAALAAKNQLLLDELRHRVPNLLQLVMSLIRMRARTVDDPEARETIEGVADTIALVSRAQAAIYSVERAPIDRLLAQICEPTFTSAAPVTCTIKASADVLPAELNVPVLLVANELVLNALQHGCAGREGSRVEVRFGPAGDGWCLEVVDDGPGLPPGFDVEQGPRNGLKLVSALARQIHARFELAGRDDRPGTAARLWLRKAPAAAPGIDEASQPRVAA